MTAKRIVLFFCAVLLFFGMSEIFAFAEAVSEEKIFGDFSALTEYVGDEEKELLEQGLSSGDGEETQNALTEMLTPTGIFSMVDAMSVRVLNDAIRLLATLCGLLLLAAVLGALKNSFGGSALSGAVDFLTSAAIFAAILSYQYRYLTEAQEMLTRLSSLMGAMIPIAGSVWAMGGNVSTASVGTASLYAFLTVTQRIVGQTVVPVCSFCMAAALCRSLGGDSSLRGISSAVKKIYTFTLGLIMTLLLTSLGASTTLSAAADSVAARTAKLLSASVIPTVGGSIGETLRTVAASVGYLKSIVGIGGIVLVMLLVLPTVLSLLSVRLVFLLAGGLAEILGCEKEARLLEELGGVFGCLLAVTAMSGVMFILALTIFVKSTVAIA